MDFNFGTSVKKVEKLFKKHSQQAGPHDLYRDWGRVLAGFFILLFFAAAAASYVYYEVSSGSFSDNAAQTVTVPAFDRTAFQAVVDSYAAKEKQLNDLRQQPVTVVDPAR